MFNTNTIQEKDDNNVDFKIQNQMDDISKQAEKLTQISSKELNKIKQEALNNNEFIEKIIKADSKNIALADYFIRINSSYYSHFSPVVFNNKQLLQTVLHNDIHAYSIPLFKNIINSRLLEYKKNKKIAELVVKNFVKMWSWLEEVEMFINTIWWKNNKIISELGGIYKDILKKAGKFYKNDINKSVFSLLNIDDKSILENIFHSKIISKAWDIHKPTLKKLEKIILEKNSTSQNVLSTEDIIDEILSFLWLNQQQYKIEEVKNLVESIRNFLNTSSLLNKQKQKDTTNKVDISSDHTDEADLDENSPALNSDINDDQDLLEFCNGSYSFTSYGDNYEIQTWYSKVEISSQDYKKMNTKSLENYLNFVSILHDSGLGFLLQSRYKSWFMNFLSQEFVWFDYKSGAWFSSYYTTQSLSKIANLIGVPKKFYWEDWETWSFDSESIAVETFKYINSTWFINNQKVAKPWGWLWNWATQTKLLENNVLWENGWFNSVAARELLKKWWYSTKKD